MNKHMVNKHMVHMETCMVKMETCMKSLMQGMMEGDQSQEGQNRAGEVGLGSQTMFKTEAPVGVGLDFPLHGGKYGDASVVRGAQGGPRVDLIQR